jgi:tetratricopeptide (TPR) repeat protein
MPEVFAYSHRAAACALALALLIYCRPARADWLEASSDHFIIYSDTSEPQLREFASRLERFDKGLRLLFITKHRTEDEALRSNRLRIFVLPSPHAIQKLYSPRQTDVMGFYVPKASGSVAFTPRRSTSGPAKFNLSAQIILLHEYAHHFLFRNSSATYPAWFAEGFAEVGSTARFEENGGLGFGLAANHRAYSLFGRHSLSIEDLLDSTRRKLTTEQVQELYARGWLLTHYCFFTPGKLAALMDYIDAINRGTPNLEAARNSFGDLAQLDKDLDRYVQLPLKYLALPANKLPIGSIEIRPLSAGAAAMMPVHIRSTRGVSHETALELVPEARRLAAPYPKDADVQAQLAEAEYDAGNLDESEAAAGRALAVDPQNVSALLFKGQILMARARAGHAKDASVWRPARSWFIKANKVDPNVAEPLVLFYLSFGLAGENPTENSVLGLNRAYELAPEDRYLRLTVACQALLDNEPRFARSILAPLAYDPHTRGMSEQLLAALDLLDAGKNSEALEALRRQPAQAEPPASEPPPTPASPSEGESDEAPKSLQADPERAAQPGK